ncbi:MAG: glycosyltransferase [Aliifodinibius sp.]|nr:glycosyltransferase [Fodinibius sp.]
MNFLKLRYNFEEKQYNYMAYEEKPLVSVVTLNFDGIRFLKDLFDSLRRCTYPNLEVIMVDNCSQDESVNFVKQNYPEVKIVENSENLMYTGGNNEGLKHAKGKYICLVNNDVDVDPGFIDPIVNAFESNARIGAAQPKILAMQERDRLEYAGACGGYIDWFGYPFLRGRLFFTTEKDEGQYDKPAELFWGSGACLFLRKDTLNEVGHFDEDFVLHQEEIDLCWRIRLAGWSIVSIPQSQIWHHVGGTLDKDSPRKTYWNFRNNLFLLFKNLSLGNLLIRLPLRVPLDFLALGIELFKGHFANARAVARAYLWLMTHFTLLRDKRRITQKQRKVPDKGIFKCVYPGSVVFEYFLLGRRKFSDLLFLKPKLGQIKEMSFEHSIINDPPIREVVKNRH